MGARLVCKVTALMLACTLNRIDVIKLLLDRGCDMNVRDKEVRQVHSYPVDSRVACNC